MSFSETSTFLDMLIRYNEEFISRVRQVNLLISSRIARFGSTTTSPDKIRELEELCQQLQKRVPSLTALLQNERQVEKWIATLSLKYHSELKKDLDLLASDLGIIFSFCQRLNNYINNFKLLQEKYEKGQTDNQQMSQIHQEYNALLDASRSLRKVEEHFSEIAKKQLYTEKLLAESLKYIKAAWETKIKNKSTWMYHATSIIFLPYIQEYGLDPKKLPAGIQRALRDIAKISGKYGWRISKSDYDNSIRIGRLFFSDTPKYILKTAAAENLPAFLYETLNEDHVKKSGRYILEQLDKTEQKLCLTIWRFGKYLRKKNKVVILQVKVNSDLLKIADIPDYLQDFDVFFSGYLSKNLDLFQTTPNLRKKVDLLCNDPIEPLFYFTDAFPVDPSQRTSHEIILQNAILPELIYISVKGMLHPKIIPIKEWNEKVNPILV